MNLGGKWIKNQEDPSHSTWDTLQEISLEGKQALVLHPQAAVFLALGEHLEVTTCDAEGNAGTVTINGHRLTVKVVPNLTTWYQVI